MNCQLLHFTEKKVDFFKNCDIFIHIRFNGRVTKQGLGTVLKTDCTFGCGFRLVTLPPIYWEISVSGRRELLHGSGTGSIPVSPTSLKSRR